MDRSLLEDLCKQCSTREIADKLKISQTNVNYWLKKYGLKTPRAKNSLLVKEKIFCKCLNCGKERPATRNSFNKYCNSKCKVEYEHTLYIDRWKRGLENGKTANNEVSNYVRYYLLDRYKSSCIKCGWDKRHPIDNMPLVEINHIDGDSSNCNENNLEVLCPNCHSMTPTHGARNKVSARPKRKILRS